MLPYLLVDGTRKVPDTTSGIMFRLDMPAQEVRLMSGFARPSDFGDSADQRRLGVALIGIRWQQGERTIDVPVTAPGFIDGFHHVERDSSGEYRWTNGNAALPPNMFPPWHGETILHLTLKTWRGSTTIMPTSPEASVLNAFENSLVASATDAGKPFIKARHDERVVTGMMNFVRRTEGRTVPACVAVALQDTRADNDALERAFWHRNARSIEPRPRNRVQAQGYLFSVPRPLKEVIDYFVGLLTLENGVIGMPGSHPAAEG